MISPASPTRADAGNSPAPWILPGSGLSVFYGRPEAPRLSHYFLPRVLLAGRRVLYVDGANRFDPLLLARMARQRGREPAEFYELVRVARAFTCFQLTEMLARVPQHLEKFAAEALIITGLPELYFDEDVREREARVSFRRALVALNALRPLPLGIALFSDATSFQTPRRGMFRELAAQASHIWRFHLASGGKLQLLGEKSALPLPA